MYGVEPAVEQLRLRWHLRSQRAEQHQPALCLGQDLLDLLRRAVAGLKVHGRDSVPRNHDDHFGIREDPQGVLSAGRNRVGQRIG